MPIADREPCLINPEDGAVRSIADGEVMRIFNNLGQMLLGARVTGTIRRGVIRVNEGRWCDPIEPIEPGPLDAYADVNCLSVDIGRSKLPKANCGHTALADAEKFKGDPPEPKVSRRPTNA